MANQEQLRPHFIFTETTPEEIKDVATAVETEAYRDPERCAAAAEVLSLGSSAVRAALEYLDRYPDGATTLLTLADFLDKRADRDVSVDPSLDEVILAAVVRKPEDPNLSLSSQRYARRCRWLAEFARRAAA